jgi:hypothetical protein
LKSEPIIPEEAPDEKEVTADAAWTNGTDYVFSESPRFNPNTVLSGDWRQMGKKR